MDTAGRAEGFDLTDPDGLLRGRELDLLLQHHLWFYFTLTPRKEGAVVEPSLQPSSKAGPGWLSRFASSSAGPIQQSS